MFTVTKKFQISAAHQLKLSYESKCSNLHGHNWNIEVRCQSNVLNQEGMVYDFSHIKKKISDQLDHQDISQKIVLDGKQVNPTAENIARWISTQIGETCVEVLVEESEGNLAIWRKDNVTSL